MKHLRTIILLLISITVLNCSGDDNANDINTDDGENVVEDNDSSTPEEPRATYLPIEIEVFYGNGNQRTCSIAYNDDNQISSLVFQYNNADDKSYSMTYSNGNLSQVVIDETHEYSFLYTDNTLSSVELVNSGNTTSFSVAYDSENNIFTFNSFDEYYFDSTDNLTRIVSGDIERLINFAGSDVSNEIFDSNFVPLPFILISGSVTLETIYFLSSKQISDVSVTYDGGFQNSTFYDYQADDNGKTIGFKIDHDWGTVMRTDEVTISYKLLETN